MCQPLVDNSNCNKTVSSPLNPSKVSIAKEKEKKSFPRLTNLSLEKPKAGREPSLKKENL